MDVAVSVQGLYKSFGEDEVLKGVTRDFEEGKIHGIVGNNGSGKTVLMKCICGFLRPTSGKVLVRYREVGKDMDFPENMGIIIETPGFLPGLTGMKNLRLLASLPKKGRERNDCQHHPAGRPGSHTEKAGGEIFAGHAPAPGDCPGDHGESVASDPG